MKRERILRERNAWVGYSIRFCRRGACHDRITETSTATSPPGFDFQGSDDVAPLHTFPATRRIRPGPEANVYRGLADLRGMDAESLHEQRRNPAQMGR